MRFGSILLDFQIYVLKFYCGVILKKDKGWISHENLQSKISFLVWKFNVFMGKYQTAMKWMYVGRLGEMALEVEEETTTFLR